jgi:hypothetical protein
MGRVGQAAPVVERGRVLGYRLRAHGLDRPAGGPADAAALGAGVQDYPVGASAHLALRVRSSVPGPAGLTGAVAELLDDGALALVHGVRGAVHLHHAADLPRYAAALRFADPRDIAVSSGGAFWGELAAQGTTLAAALDQVAAAMRQVMADGRSRTKGELSEAVQEPVDPRLRPWCEGCQAHHVHDQLFRMATLQAGLRLRRGVPSDPLCFLPPADAAAAGTRLDPDQARREIIGRFLKLCGPATPDQLGAWLALSPAGARRVWALVADELTEVQVDGRRAWVPAADLDDLLAAPEPPAGPETVKLLGPYDPWAGLADRRLLAPDPARRREVWRAAANPGLLLAGGEIVGVWRQRRSGGSAARLTITVRAFDPLDAAVRDAARADAENLALAAGAASAELRVEA